MVLNSEESIWKCIFLIKGLITDFWLNLRSGVSVQILVTISEEKQNDLITNHPSITLCWRTISLGIIAGDRGIWSPKVLQFAWSLIRVINHLIFLPFCWGRWKLCMTYGLNLQEKDIKSILMTICWPKYAGITQVIGTVRKAPLPNMVKVILRNIIKTETNIWLPGSIHIFCSF